MSTEKMDSGSDKKEPKIIIAELEQSFQDWLKENPDLAEKIKGELMSIYGYDEAEMSAEGMAIIKVPLGQLSIFSTFCGTSGNKAFGENVVNFLKDKEIEFVVAISDKEVPNITSAMININREDGEALSEMIGENNGSLRCDSSKNERWSTFESE